MRIKFMNTQIDNITMEEAIDRIGELVVQRKPTFVVTPNVDHIVQIERDPEFKKVYEKADLILTDGQPLVWFSRLYRTKIKEKISGSDLFPRLCKMAAQRNFTMFFLGAAEGVAAKAAKNLTHKYPGLQVVGTYSPPRGFEKNPVELKKAIDIVHAKQPDILIVGLGAPKQEKFMYYNKEKLSVPVSLGLGASLDFEAGNVKRAPKWMRNIGMEWLYRLAKEPKRMFKRYIIDDMLIFKLLIKYWPHPNRG